MYLCLFEDDATGHLAPLTLTRPTYGLRLGQRTLLETTRDAFPEARGLLLHARPALAATAGQAHDALVNRVPAGLDVLFVNGRYVAAPGDVLDRLRAAARPGEPARRFVQNGTLVAAWVPGAALSLDGLAAVTAATFEALPEETLSGARLVGRLWDLLADLDATLERDFAARTEGYRILDHPRDAVHEGARLVHPDRIFIAPTAQIRPGAVLNAEAGPIYVDEGALVMENAVVRGPAYLGPKAQIKVAGIIDGCALGPWTKAGGEVHASIVQGYSNKAHAGYLGNSYLGAWCNLGADTNTSNLKNDYGEVTLYDAATGRFEPSGRQFLGLVMGDHAKCGINTMFNTGTVVGVSCNLYGCGFQPRYVPSFSWGGPDGLAEYRLDKALAVAEVVMARRNVPFTPADRALLTALFEHTRAERAAP